MESHQGRIYPKWANPEAAATCKIKTVNVFHDFKMLGFFHLCSQIFLRQNHSIELDHIKRQSFRQNYKA